MIIAVQVVRVVSKSATDPEAASRDIAIGVGITAIAVLLVAAVIYMRGSERRKRRAQLGTLWLDDVQVRADDPEGLSSPETPPRDFAIGIDGDSLQVWARGDAPPVAVLRRDAVNTVGTVAVETNLESEQSVVIGTDRGEWTFTPVTLFGLPPSRRRMERLLSAVRTFAGTSNSAEQT